MSGVAGILLRQEGKPAAAADIQRMLARMQHRAPDGSSWWMDASVVLGHAWLNTTDEAGPGPLTMAGGKLAITADCRLAIATNCWPGSASGTVRSLTPCC